MISFWWELTLLRSFHPLYYTLLLVIYNEKYTFYISFIVMYLISRSSWGITQLARVFNHQLTQQVVIDQLLWFRIFNPRD